MKLKFKNLLGCILIPIGLLVVAFSNKIVFPGLERLFGIEAIVGKENVVYEPDGGYYFTNPKAMVEWIGAVAILGFLICIAGMWLSGIKVKIPAKKVQETSN
jgi:ascorbate-specific PTS system EIIC-type component UlaA